MGGYEKEKGRFARAALAGMRICFTWKHGSESRRETQEGIEDADTTTAPDLEMIRAPLGGEQSPDFVLGE
jgi:hypothetical protein